MIRRCAAGGNAAPAAPVASSRFVFIANAIGPLRRLGCCDTSAGAGGAQRCAAGGSGRSEYRRHGDRTPARDSPTTPRAWRSAPWAISAGAKLVRRCRVLGPSRAATPVTRGAPTAVADGPEPDAARAGDPAERREKGSGPALVAKAAGERHEQGGTCGGPAGAGGCGPPRGLPGPYCRSRTGRGVEGLRRAPTRRLWTVAVWASAPSGRDMTRAMTARRATARSASSTSSSRTYRFIPPP